MRVIAVSTENNVIREKFFRVAFGDNSGYMALAAKEESGRFHEAFFMYPNELNKALEWINRNLSKRDLYFCPQLLEAPKRTKQKVSITPTLWSDLDEVDPKKVEPKPSVMIETSPGRYQALWILSEKVPPEEAERISRKLAYANKADISGWDLTQLLRIPLTYNMKYDISSDTTIVQLVDVQRSLTYGTSDFKELEEAPDYKKIDIPLPEDKIGKLDPEKILKKNRAKLLPNVFALYENAPETDWSKALWSLQCQLLEAGLSPEETFVVAWSSATNKYERDNRSRGDLWRETLKAKASVDLQTVSEDEIIQVQPLLSLEEIARVQSLPDTFVERYIDWAKSRTDAAPQYHQAGAFIILSTICAEGVHLPTSFGTLVPNLWFMILGDTTLTRKTTAMEMAVENILVAYESAMLATDGSIEGILTALSERPNLSSVFYRDEFSGLLDSMRKKDYYSGMMEALTKLYDGKYQRRVLRKDIIEIRDPVFIMFCGGIKTRIMEMVDIEHIVSGFLPRFIFIAAEPDMENFKPAGPGTPQMLRLSADIAEEIVKMKEVYSSDFVTSIGEQTVTTKKIWDAELTEEAWARYNQLERTLVEAGVKSEVPELYTPTMDRLAKSSLKAAILIAASRQDPREKDIVTVELDDVLRAAWYTNQWKDDSLYVLRNAGKSVSERQLDKALRMIREGKGDRSTLMRHMHLTANQADMILDTLEQRGQIIRTKQGKAEKLHPVSSR